MNVLMFIKNYNKQKSQPPKQTNKSVWKLNPSFAINLQ